MGTFTNCCILIRLLQDIDRSAIYLLDVCPLLFCAHLIAQSTFGQTPFVRLYPHIKVDLEIDVQVSISVYPCNHAFLNILKKHEMTQKTE